MPHRRCPQSVEVMILLRPPANYKTWPLHLIEHSVVAHCRPGDAGHTHVEPGDNPAVIFLLLDLDQAMLLPDNGFRRNFGMLLARLRLLNHAFPPVSD